MKHSILRRKVKKQTKKKEALTLKDKIKPPPKSKLLRPTLSRADYLEMMITAGKYPLLHRLAAELWRSGLRLAQFEREYHKEDNGVSRQVYEYMTQFHFSRGYDPEKIPPYLPQYIKADEVVPSRTLFKKGRPSDEEAESSVASILKHALRAGWTEYDFERAVNAHFENKQSAVPVIKMLRAVSGDTEDEEDEVQAHPTKAGASCDYCGFSLINNGTTPTLVGTLVDDRLSMMHLSCFWLQAKPASIPLNLTVFDAKVGQAKTWNGHQWKVSVAATAEQTENVEPAATLPVQTSGTGAVREVPTAGDPPSTAPSVLPAALRPAPRKLP